MHNRDQFILYLYNGVTTVRNMWGVEADFHWRELINGNKILGPNIYTTSPIIDGYPPFWQTSKVIEQPEEVNTTLTQYKLKGYEQLKVFVNLRRETYYEIIKCAKNLNLKVVGHIPIEVGLRKALELGQYSIEHLDGYLSVLAEDYKFPENINREERLQHAVNNADISKIPEIVKMTVDKGVWNCATLVVHQRTALAKDDSTFRQEPEMQYINPTTLARFYMVGDGWKKNTSKEIEERKDKHLLILYQLVQELIKQKAKILLGTDAPNPYVLPGFSIHLELANLVQAGYSPYEAIKAGTTSAAEFLNKNKIFGTLEVGKQADILVVKENPLQNIKNLKDLFGVMARGNWFSKEFLDEQMEELKAKFKNEFNVFEDFSLPEKFANLPVYEYELLNSNKVVSSYRVSLLKGKDDMITIYMRGFFMVDEIQEQIVTFKKLNTMTNLEYKLTSVEGILKVITTYKDGLLEINYNPLYVSLKPIKKTMKLSVPPLLYLNNFFLCILLYLNNSKIEDLSFKKISLLNDLEIVEVEATCVPQSKDYEYKVKTPNENLIIKLTKNNDLFPENIKIESFPMGSIINFNLKKD